MGTARQRLGTQRKRNAKDATDSVEARRRKALEARLKLQVVKLALRVVELEGRHDALALRVKALEGGKRKK